MKLCVEVERWPRNTPMRITGYTFDVINVVTVSLEKEGCVGRGEAAGVYYQGDSPKILANRIESVRATIEAGIDPESLRQLLPAGGARNAVDCALWDLQAKLARKPVWTLAGLEAPRPLLTTFTCHADVPEKMVARARGYRDARAIKLKLTGEPVDADRVRAVRESFPEVWLGVDANQGFTRASLEKLLPVLVDARVSLIEQPFPVGQEQWLDGFDAPIPIAADESAQVPTDLPALVGRFSVVNIKLDKCGGLTEGLAMARAAQTLGFTTMVGNMGGTSLAMAPAALVGQLCGIVDLDGPVFLKSDRAVAIEYRDGLIVPSDAVWGGG